MPALKLVLGNKRYSSWSLRPWLVATHFGIPFEEIPVALEAPDRHERILRWSPSGRVPCLIDGDLHVWETLAIVETLAERYPEKAIWPRDPAARAYVDAVLTLPAVLAWREAAARETAIVADDEVDCAE